MDLASSSYTISPPISHLLERSGSRPPFDLAASWRPDHDSHFFSQFLSRERATARSISSAFWVHRIKKAALIADGIRRPTEPVEARPHLLASRRPLRIASL